MSEKLIEVEELIFSERAGHSTDFALAVLTLLGQRLRQKGVEISERPLLAQLQELRWDIDPVGYILRLRGLTEVASELLLLRQGAELGSARTGRALLMEFLVSHGLAVAELSILRAGARHDEELRREHVMRRADLEKWLLRASLNCQRLAGKLPALLR